MPAERDLQLRQLWQGEQASPELFADRHPEVIPAPRSTPREVIERFEALGRLDLRLARVTLERWSSGTSVAMYRLAVAAALVGVAKTARQHAAAALAGRDGGSATEIELGHLGAIEAELRLAAAGLTQAAEFIGSRDGEQVAAAMVVAAASVGDSALSLALSCAEPGSDAELLYARRATEARATARSAGLAAALADEVAAGLFG